MPGIISLGDLLNDTRSDHQTTPEEEIKYLTDKIKDMQTLVDAILIFANKYTVDTGIVETLGKCMLDMNQSKVRIEYLLTNMKGETND